MTCAHRAPIISAAARNNVPAVYYQSYYARDGGLLSYGVDRVDLFRRAASYADRILRGAKPADLPVQLPTKLEMVVNLKTAKALGLTVPLTRSRFPCGPRRFLGLRSRAPPPPLGPPQQVHPRLPVQRLGFPGWADVLTSLILYFFTSWGPGGKPLVEFFGAQLAMTDNCRRTDAARRLNAAA